MKSTELMRMRTIVTNYKTANREKLAIQKLLTGNQNKCNLLLDKQQYSKALEYEFRINAYQCELAFRQSEIKEVDLILVFIQKSQKSREYQMFCEYCFENQNQARIASRYNYSNTTTSAIIRRIAILFLEYWDKFQDATIGAKDGFK